MTLEQQIDQCVERADTVIGELRQCGRTMEPSLRRQLVSAFLFLIGEENRLRDQRFERDAHPRIREILREERDRRLWSQREIRRQFEKSAS